MFWKVSNLKRIIVKETTSLNYNFLGMFRNIDHLIMDMLEHTIKPLIMEVTENDNNHNINSLHFNKRASYYVTPLYYSPSHWIGR